MKKYKRAAENWFDEQVPEYNKPICIYLKTGNESLKRLKEATDEGFKVFDRGEFISVLEKHELKNDICNDFKTRLTNLEKSNKEWESRPIKEWGDHHWPGFFQYLEKKGILCPIGWHSLSFDERSLTAVLDWFMEGWGIYPVFLQAELSKLCFKISTYLKHFPESAPLAIVVLEMNSVK